MKEIRNFIYFKGYLSCSSSTGELINERVLRETGQGFEVAEWVLLWRDEDEVRERDDILSGHVNVCACVCKNFFMFCAFYLIFVVAFFCFFAFLLFSALLCVNVCGCVCVAAHKTHITRQDKQFPASSSGDRLPSCHNFVPPFLQLAF